MLAFVDARNSQDGQCVSYIRRKCLGFPAGKRQNLRSLVLYQPPMHRFRVQDCSYLRVYDCGETFVSSTMIACTGGSMCVGFSGLSLTSRLDCTTRLVY